MRGRTAGILVVTALLGAGALWWWLGHPAPRGSQGHGASASHPAPAPDAVQPRPVTAIDSGAAVSGATAAAAIPPPSDPVLAQLALPPENTPVQKIFDELLERARRGDARAACRLAADLQRCTRLAELPGMATELERRAVAASNDGVRDSMIDSIARIEDARWRHGSQCEGLTPAQRDHAFALQVQAAQARPELRVWAATHPALDMQYFVGDLDRWAQYRQFALPWLQSAAAQGDLSALVVLARIHGDARRPGPRFPPFRRIDDRRAVLYAALLERYGVAIPAVQADAEERRTRLDANAMAAIEAEADAMFRPELAVAPDQARTAQILRRSFDRIPDPADCE